jgi:hypothetical protein
MTNTTTKPAKKAAPKITFRTTEERKTNLQTRITSTEQERLLNALLDCLIATCESAGGRLVVNKLLNGECKLVVM